MVVNTISIILDVLDNDKFILSLSKNHFLLNNSKKILLIFIAQEKWFNYNEPRNALASINSLNHSEKIYRNRIIQFLNQIEKTILEINRKAEVVKIVVFGEEKYKVSKCLKMLKVEMCLIKNKKKNLLNILLSRPLHEFINEKLGIPVVLM